MNQPIEFPTRKRLPAKARRHALYPFAWRTPVLLVPGLYDSGPDHWQSRWQQAHPDVTRVAQADYALPDIDRWAANVALAIEGLRSAPVVVAHSFGCLAAVRAALAHGSAIAGALLVAPAEPQRFGVVPSLLDGELSFPTTLVASTDDPWLALGAAHALASRWGSRIVTLANAGHINAESGHGEWAEGLALLRDVAECAAAAGTIHQPGRRAVWIGVARATA